MSDNKLIYSIILIVFMSTFTFCGDPDIHDGLIKIVNQ